MANEIQEQETLVPEVDAEVETNSEDEENEDETIVPPLEEQPTERDIEELKTAPPKEEVDDTETETTEVVNETEESVPKQPKPVEGETPKEQALRIQIQKLREKIRDKDEVIKIAQPIISDEEYEALKDEYTPEELQKVEKLFDVIGKKKGYVKAEDIYTQSGNEVLEAFIEKHPEYKPENDLDDFRWNTFKNILTKDYNRVGKQPKELTKLFEKVNRDVLEEFGESPKKTISSSKLNAEIQKVRSVSHTGGTKTEISKKSNAPTDPNVRKMFKDFDDDDF